MITALNGIIASSIASVSYDADAQLFFNAESAAGVTLTTTEMNAVNQWVIDSKAANIWTKFKAIYPIVGGTATSHKFNLKNPADTNAAFRLVFAGGLTHSSSGILGGGVNGIADTFLNPTIDLTQFDCHVSTNIYTNTFSGASKVHLFSDNNSTPMGLAAISSTIERSAMGIAFLNTTVTPSTHRGFWATSRSSSGTNGVNYLLANGTINKYTAAGNFASANIKLFGSVTGAAGYSNFGYSFFTIGNALTDLESLILKQITEKYQVALGRNTVPTQSFYYNSAYNNETNAFLFSTQITDNTIQTATNTLVSDLKTANIFTKMKAIYPMVGGTATTCKFNLANAQDTNAAFRLVFNGGVTHSSSGVKGNNTNSWADTKLIPLSNLTLNSFHCAFNIYNDATGGFGGFFGQTSIGVQNQSTSAITLFSSSATNQTTQMGRLSPIISKTVTATTHKGFWCGSRTANNVNNLIDPTGAITLESSAITYTMPNTTIGLLAQNNSSIGVNSFSNFGYSFFSIGDGLTPAEMTNFKTAVNNFQTALGRI
jgi:hypothetical protein